MKTILILFIMFSSIFSAQNQRFSYLYQYIPDSANRTDVKSEIVLLEVLPQFSKFYSQDVYQSDSLMNATIMKELAATGSMNVKTDMRKGTFREVVLKESNGTTSLFTRIGRTEIKVNDERKMDWKIQPEKEKIGEFSTQKATTTFAGRKWTAWFTTAIAIQDGPYKFKGLPGLIVKLEDDTKSHSFELKEVKNLTPLEIKEIDPNKNFVFTFREQLEMDRARFKKFFVENRNDPNKAIRSSLGQSDVKIISADGTSLNNTEALRSREKQQKERIAKDNNLLELDLLK